MDETNSLVPMAAITASLNVIGRQRAGFLSPAVRATSLCPDCDGCSYMLAQRSGRTFALECNCLLERRALARIAPKFRDAMLSDFPAPVLEQAVRWLAHPTQGLVISGKCGRGKTHLAAAMVRTAILVGRDAWMRRAFEFFSEVRRAISANGEQEALDAFVKPRYLAIDDLMWEFSSYERKIFFELLDRRGETNRPTIITTNDDLAQIARTTDERLASRLSDFDWMRLDGPDLRQFPPLKSSRTVELTSEMLRHQEQRKREVLARYGTSAQEHQLVEVGQ